MTHHVLSAIEWKRPGSNSFNSIGASLLSGQCSIKTYPEKYESTIKEVVITLTLHDGESDLEESMRESAVNNETVEMNLSIEGYSETLDHVEGRVSPDAKALVEGGPFMVKVSSTDEERFAPLLD